MKRCRNCGKRFDVLWPELWRYKKGYDRKQAVWFCSWKCLREDEKKEEEKKGEKKMGRPRKNLIPSEERPVIELVYDESIKEEYRKEQEEKKKAGMGKELEVAAVFSRVLDGHTFKKIDGGMALTGRNTTLVLTEEDWERLVGEITQAQCQLKGGAK